MHNEMRLLRNKERNDNYKIEDSGKASKIEKSTKLDAMILKK